MPGLPCDVCQEDTSYILYGEDRDDAEGVTYYRRYRVCTNKTCEVYLHRRTTVEYYVVETGTPRIYKPEEFNRIQRALGTEPPQRNDDRTPLLPWAELETG